MQAQEYTPAFPWLDMVHEEYDPEHPEIPQVHLPSRDYSRQWTQGFRRIHFNARQPTPTLPSAPREGCDGKCARVHAFIEREEDLRAHLQQLNCEHSFPSTLEFASSEMALRVSTSLWRNRWMHELDEECRRITLLRAISHGAYKVEISNGGVPSIVFNK